MDGRSTLQQLKSKSTPKWRHQKIAHKNRQIQQRKAQTVVDTQYTENDTVTTDAFDPEGIETRRRKGSQAPRTFSQPSVISNGDKGIFVTTDIGREKKGLVELSGLVEELLEDQGLLSTSTETHTSPLSNVTINAANIDINNDVNTDDESDMDIEASIQRELSNLTSNASNTIPDGRGSTLSAQQQKVPPKPFQLITLDIPCVSFLRFHPLYPTYTHIDPEYITHSLCDTAMTTGIMRSRFIRRLSPISWLCKALASGLEKCSDIVLPPHFDLHDDTNTTAIATSSSSSINTKTNARTQRPCAFAIRPSIRNNDKLTRDDVIKYIADQIAQLGEGKHKVDLKNYQKGVLVEVYRGWIGMSVVTNDLSSSLNETSAEQQDTRANPGFKHTYEELKRFNLAEIYAVVLNKGREPNQDQAQEQH